jgi:outer membrane receptor protein involved in Fe transport
LYLQDEWKPFEQLTINFGGRLDFVNAFADENQLSPRINIVYEPFKGTAFHAGYARYFTPPPFGRRAANQYDRICRHHQRAGDQQGFSR